MLKGLLCRAILFPKCAKDGVFDDLALLQLVDVNKDKTVYAMSLASRYLLRDEEGAHGYGSRTAQSINDAYENSRGEPPPENKRTHYLGFYDVDKLSVLSLPISYYRVELKHKIEHGETAHFNFEMHPTDLQGTNEKARRHDRNTAMLAMITRLRGPKRRVFNEGHEDAERLSSFQLPELPRPAP